MPYKLNDKKIGWIIREIEKGELTRNQIAWTQKVSRFRVSQLWREYKRTGKMPVLKPPGRPPKQIESWEIQVIRSCHEKYLVGPCLLEGRIEEDYGLHIPHNRIHRIMLQLGLSKEEMRKKRRRRWVRYERAHSMELWHTDWKWLKEEEKWIIAYEDDASRYIASYGLYDTRSTEASIDVLEKGISLQGVPDAVLTDRGSEFYASDYDGKPKGTSRYAQHLSKRGIRHIVGRVNHPQTNGKIERFYGTVEQKLPLFHGDVDGLIRWYNHIKPHMSLSLDGRRYDTPLEAFWYKMDPGRLLGYAQAWLWEETT